MRVPLALLLAFAFLSGCLAGTGDQGDDSPIAADPGVGDAVVVAVVDSGFNPYHFDFRASLMPQQTNEDLADDLPLDQDPATWLPGHPGADAFASYGRLDLTLPDDPKSVPNDLHTQDAKQWETVQGSGDGQVHMRWIPGTKVIGAVTFNSGDGYASGSHGVGTSSVSVGNLHGSCPHCLLVFVDGTQEQANRWVEQQDWIDLQTNSWGFSTTVVGRERVYAHSDTDSQRMAVDRGQGIFFSAGNGVDGSFVATNPTLFSSQEGPDWIITVGAIMPDGSSTGHGKPADVSSLGTDYPSAYGATNLTNGNGFGGTSNATPVTAGMYAESLYRLRRLLAGASRMQEAGVIATGPAGCLEANAECALSDGQLTVHEMREALFRSATYTEQGWDVGGATGPIPGTTGPEATFLAEGHGSYWGRLLGDERYGDELARIEGFAAGAWHEDQPAEQAAWFVADSLCRQGGWGAWEHGYAQSGVPAPARDANWPARSWLAHDCPPFLGAMVTVEKQLPNTNDLPL
ncbi:MAG: S8/S53 family peptidase [Candidatus Thermoplasmatota archaeon]|mgnify:CR=1 FL=1